MSSHSIDRKSTGKSRAVSGVEADTSGLEGLSQAQGLASLNFMDKDENFCGSDGSVRSQTKQC